MRELFKYHVAHKQRPADIVDFNTLEEVRRCTHLSLPLIHDNIDNGRHWKGWIITKTLEL